VKALEPVGAPERKSDRGALASLPTFEFFGDPREVASLYRSKSNECGSPQAALDKAKKMIEDWGLSHIVTPLLRHELAGAKACLSPLPELSDLNLPKAARIRRMGVLDVSEHRANELDNAVERCARRFAPLHQAREICHRVVGPTPFHWKPAHKEKREPCLRHDSPGGC
jgi:hypothetical protein